MASYVYRYHAVRPIKVRLIISVRFVITNTRSAILRKSVVDPEATRDTDEIPCLVQYPHTDQRKEKNLAPPSMPSGMSYASGMMPKMSSGFAPSPCACDTRDTHRKAAVRLTLIGTSVSKIKEY